MLASVSFPMIYELGTRLQPATHMQNSEHWHWLAGGFVPYSEFLFGCYMWLVIFGMQIPNPRMSSHHGIVYILGPYASQLQRWSLYFISCAAVYCTLQRQSSVAAVASSTKAMAQTVTMRALPLGALGCWLHHHLPRLLSYRVSLPVPHPCVRINAARKDQCISVSVCLCRQNGGQHVRAEDFLRTGLICFCGHICRFALLLPLLQELHRHQSVTTAGI